MPNYISYRKPKGRPRRFVVIYEEGCKDGKVTSFSVQASLFSEATAKVIDYITHHNFHNSYFDYYLYPSVSDEDADIDIV